MRFIVQAIGWGKLSKDLNNCIYINKQMGNNISVKDLFAVFFLRVKQVQSRRKSKEIFLQRPKKYSIFYNEAMINDHIHSNNLSS